MAIGKNKNVGKKGAQKRKTDPYLRKEWYHIRAPAVFSVRNAGRTVVTKSSGNKLARDNLVGRVFELAQGDLVEKGTEEESFRKFKLRVEEVQGSTCLTNFHGMDLTTDKLRSLVRKWHTLIEAQVDVRTTDNYHLRIFAIGFTKSRGNQHRKTSYAKHSQVKAIRKKMVDIMTREASSVDLSELVSKLMNEVVGREIEKSCQGIYPLQNVHVRKVKVVRGPKTDITKLLEIHGGAASLAETGDKVERTDAENTEPTPADADTTEETA